MPTTGKSINISGFALSRVKDGKIYEEHTYWNVLELYKQLGFQVIPPKDQRIIVKIKLLSKVKYFANK